MTTREIEERITFAECPVDRKTNTVMIKGTFTLDYFARFDAGKLESSNGPEWIKIQIKKDITEHIMRKLYDDQRESLYKAIYELRGANPLDPEALRNAYNVVLAAALRQPSE